MAWNNYRYEQVKSMCQENITRGWKTCADYMLEYKAMVKKEDYEACKAITEVLDTYGYKTADTHKTIPSLNQ